MFETLFNILLMILGFGLLIFVHELGHFLAAKWAGIRTEAFAIGMGPVIVAWRKGIGMAAGSTHSRVIHKTGKPASELSDAELDKYGIGETEYSLRWLPLGGFVRMLGQEDANPEAVSDDPRSYTKCAIGKRMVVVSAGVIMNLILAAILFVGVFMKGVEFDAPVVGQVVPNGPAATAVAENAAELGLDQPGLLPGDVVTFVDGREARTFADVQIAGAMSRPDVPVRLTVHRPGFEQPLHFAVSSTRDETLGLQSIGVLPGFSLELPRRDRGSTITAMLDRAGLTQQGVVPGMTMISADGRDITTFQQWREIVEQSAGEAITTVWTDGEATVSAMLTPQPELDLLLYPAPAPDAIQHFESGLFGLTPLVSIDSLPAGSPNDGVLQAGDVVLRVGDLHAPRMRQFREAILACTSDTLAMLVLRDGREVLVDVNIARRGVFDGAGQVGVMPGYAIDQPYIAKPMEKTATLDEQGNRTTHRTPIADLQLFPGTRLDAVNGTPIESWRDFRAALREHTQSALQDGTDASIDLTVTHPTPGSESELVSFELSHDDIASLHELGFGGNLEQFIFEPLQVTRTAGGNPLAALKMGGEETWKMTQLTYLTIDRLFRRTVGVEQLRGPIGIVHVGVTIADRGLLYLVFLLAAISVNLAVINFLPLPIVDGGLFLFLIYEKFKGKPPSIAFQNWATILGLVLIGTLFLVVTYNDIARLLS